MNSHGIAWAPSLPRHWSATRLKWLAKVYSGGTPSKDVPEYWQAGTVPWINSGAVNSWAVKEPSALITRSALRASSARWVPAGSIVMALAGQGRTKGMSARLGIDTTCNQSMAAIVPREQLEARFLHFWLAGNYRSIRHLAGGDNRDGLNLEHVGGIEVPVPPIDEQRRIADFLDESVASIDQIITARRVQIGGSKALEQSRLEESLVHTNDAMIPLRRLGVTVTTGPFGTVFAASDYVTDGVPMVNPTHIKDGLIHPDLDHGVSKETAKRLTRHRLREQDLVVSRKGDIGRTAMIRSHQDGWICGSDSIALHAKGTKMLPEMLDLLLKLDSVRDQLLAQSNAATMPSLNEGNLLSLMVPAISLNEQLARVESARIARHWAQSFGRKIDASIDLLTEYKQSLITAAVSGKLDVSTANSEIPG